MLADRTIAAKKRFILTPSAAAWRPGTRTAARPTDHQLVHGEQDGEEGVEGAAAVGCPPLALQTSPVHPHVPVGELLDEADEAGHHRVEAVRCGQVARVIAPGSVGVTPAE